LTRAKRPKEFSIDHPEMPGCSVPGIQALGQALQGASLTFTIGADNPLGRHLVQHGNAQARQTTTTVNPGRHDLHHTKTGRNLEPGRDRPVTPPHDPKRTLNHDRVHP
jgi:hypothetical protein